MPTIRLQIMDLIETDLNAPGKPAGLTVHRDRDRPIETDQLPAILFYAEDDTPKTLAGIQYKSPLTERQLKLILEIRAVVPAGQTDDEVLDPLVIWGTTQILGNESFDGLANGVDEGPTNWLTREGETDVGAVAVHFTVKYRTSRLDPTKKT